MRLFIMLTIAILVSLPQVSSAGDYISISKVHQSYFRILDLQQYYVDDSLLIQTSKATVFADDEILRQTSTIRVVRFDSGMVYEVYPSGAYAEISLDRFQELYHQQRQEALERSQERAKEEDRLLKSRRRMLDGAHLRRHGRWKERFNWQTDTLALTTPIETSAGSGHLTRMRRIGDVKKRDDDTLYVDRILQTVPENQALSQLGAALARTFGHDADPEQFLHWYFQKYCVHSNESFLNSVNEPVPSDAGFDTTMLDLELPAEGLPILTTLRVEINPRTRNPQLIDRAVARFADQDYAIKILAEEHVLLLDSLTVLGTKRDTSSAPFTPTLDSFALTEFEEDRILRFFETESWIILWTDIFR